MKSPARFTGLIFALSLFCAASLFSQEGFLRVTSVPENADVEIEGKAVGKTPLITALKPGEYTVKTVLAGYAPSAEKAKIVENEVTILQVTLEKQARKGVFQRLISGEGNLTVITDWQDVDIYLDGHRIDEKPPATIKNIPAGLHTVILVSGDYADFSRVLVQKGKTAVVKKSFEEEKKKILARTEAEEKALMEARAEEIEKKRQALPASIVVRLDNPELKEEEEKQDIPLWSEGDLITVSFQYRKKGETDWKAREIDSKNKKEDAFQVEKGSYEIQLTAAHFKEPKGIINIFLGEKREKIKEYRETLKQDFNPDHEYTYSILYDGKTDFSYKIESTKLNTEIEL